MHVFYCPDILNQKQVVLPQSEMHHAVHVLRAKAGDFVQLLDGVGNIYDAKISSINKKQCVTDIISVRHEYNNWKIKIHIAIAPTKSSDRFDFFLEKATEIGIDEITLLVSKNSERRKANEEKQLQTIISAAKQSKKANLPKLNTLTNFESCILTQKNKLQKNMIAHCRTNVKTYLANEIHPNKNLLLLVGPEGDFEQEEIDFAEKNNFTSVSLGDYRLRTETAGIVACQTIHTVIQMHAHEK